MYSTGSSSFPKGERSVMTHRLHRGITAKERQCVVCIVYWNYSILAIAIYKAEDLIKTNGLNVQSDHLVIRFWSLRL